jgi:hypothetical protein
MTRASLVRMWWAAPGALVAASAVGAAIVVGPTLGEQVTVPRQLVVPVAAPNPTPTPATARPSTPPRPHPSPTLTPTSVASLVPSTRVVEPRRPIVTASPDDDQHRESPGVEHESGDG